MVHGFHAVFRQVLLSMQLIDNKAESRQNLCPYTEEKLNFIHTYTCITNIMLLPHSFRLIAFVLSGVYMLVVKTLIYSIGEIPGGYMHN